MKNPVPLILLFIVFNLLFSCQTDVQKINYLDESIAQKQNRMAWWDDARFGMFIHWGLYAVPAGEWNGETNHAEWIRTTAQIPLETYDQFIHEFNPVKYNPEKWVAMAKNAGMKYIVITSKHHDGFCLFDSKYTDFDVMSTPYANDLLKPLADAAHKAGLRICWYHSIMDWHHPDYLPRRGWENDRSAEGADFDRYIAYMKKQLQELVDNYGDIGVLWFDGEWEGTWSNEYGKDLYNYVRNLDPDIIINNRVDVGRSGMEGMTRSGGYAGDFGTPEQEIPATGLPGVYWETCMTMNDHWGYNKNDNNWKSTEDLIQKLADIASKGGNFLLNVGPKADGTFPDESIERLDNIGKWMQQNGESIYGTKASPFKNLTFGRCTQKSLGENTRLYFHVFDWPANDTLAVHGIYNEAVNAYLLADQNQESITVWREEDALFMHLAAPQPDSINSVVVVDIKGKADISNPPEILAEHEIFLDKLLVTLKSERQNIEIRYTLDGSIPQSDSPLYTNPFFIEKSTNINARCFRKGKAVSSSQSKQFNQVGTVAPENPADLKTGLLAIYLEGDWDRVPNMDNNKIEFQQVVANISISPKKRDDYYAFIFEGYIKVPEDGIYDFYTDSDDGSYLCIGDRLIVDNDGLHGMELKQGTIPLASGYHKIKVGYFEKNGNDDLKVYIKGPEITFQEIPESFLFHSSPE